MNQYSTRYLLLFVLSGFLSISPSYCQIDKFVSGYLLTNERDTVRGFVFSDNDYRLSRQLIFRPNLKAPNQFYQPFEVDGYGMEANQHFRSASINSSLLTDTAFIRELVLGELSLYQSSTTEKVTIFLLKDSDGNWIPLSKSSWKTLLAGATQACDEQDFPQLRESASYSAKSLMNVLITYNEWATSSQPIQIRNRRRNIPKKGLLLGGGMATANIDYPTTLDDVYQGSPHINVGVYIRAVVSRRISFQLEGYYDRISLTSVEEFSLVTKEKSIRYQNLSIGAVVHYDLLLLQSTPYLLFGLSYNQSLNSKGRVRQRLNSVANFDAGDWMALDLNSPVGYFGGIGYLLQFPQGAEIQLEGRVRALIFNQTENIIGFQLLLGIGI